MIRVSAFAEFVFRVSNVKIMHVTTDTKTMLKDMIIGSNIAWTSHLKECFCFC